MADQPKKGRRFWRVVVIVVGVMGLLAAAGLTVAPYFIPWDKVKDETEIRLSQILHHRVTLGSVRFNPFKGIEVRDLRVDNAKGFSDQPLLTDEAAIVRYRLLPLLLGRVMIKTIELQKPNLLIERQATGVFNFSDMLPASGATRTPPATAGPKKSPRLPLELFVSEFKVVDGSLSFRDLGSKQDYRLEAFHLTINNLTLAGLTPVETVFSTVASARGVQLPIRAEADWQFRFREGQWVLNRLKASVPGVVVIASGHADQVLQNPVLDLAGTVDADFAKLWTLAQPVLSRPLSQRLTVAGTAALRFEVQGPIKDPQALSAKLENRVVLQAKLQEQELPVEVTGMLSLKRGELSLEQAATLPGSQAQVKANVADGFKTRRLTAHFSSTVDLKKSLSPWLATAASPVVASAQVEGLIKTQGSVQGSLMALQALEGTLSIQAQGMGLVLQGKSLLEALNASLTLTPQKIKLSNVSARLGGQPIKASVGATGFDLRDPMTLKPGTLAIRADAALSSPLLDLDALLALVPAKAPAPGAADPSAQAAPDRPEPDVRTWMPAGLVFQGKAELGGVKFGDVKFGAMNFQATLEKQRLKEKGRITGYQGTIQETVRLDFSNPRLGFNVEAETRDVNLEPLMNDVVQTFLAAKLKKPELVDELKDKLTGRLNGNLAIQSQGLRSETVKQTLTGSGTFTLRDGRLRKLAFQDELARLFGSDKFQQDIPFDHTLAEFTLADERAQVTRFVAESGPQGRGGEIRLTAQGELTYAAAFRNFKLQPQLSPRASAALAPEFSQYTAALQDEAGWVTIPVVLNGPMKKPDVKPDWNWIKAQMGQLVKKKASAAAEQAGKKIQQFLGNVQGQSGETPPKNMTDELNKAKEKLKNINLKNLFK